MWRKNIACSISKQWCCSHQAITLQLLAPSVSPVELRIKTNGLPTAKPSSVQPPPTMYPEGIQDGEKPVILSHYLISRLNFKPILIKTLWYWWGKKKAKYNKGTQRRLERNPHKCSQMVFDQETKTIQWRIVFLTNRHGTTGQIGETQLTAVHNK